MRKELEVFENRSDDWLAKQRKQEARISAWDLDEGRKLKEDHAKIHQMYLADYQSHTSDSSFKNMFVQQQNRNKRGSVKYSSAKISLAIFVIVMYLISMLIAMFIA